MFPFWPLVKVFGTCHRLKNNQISANNTDNEKNIQFIVGQFDPPFRLSSV